MKPILMVAAACLLLSLATIDPAGNFPNLPAGPGLTLDESFNVQAGTFLVKAEAAYGLAALSPASQAEIFGQALNDHPPLGRWALGLSNVVVSTVAGPLGGGQLGTAAAARPAACVAFALTVLLAGWATRRWSGDAAGFWAALVLATTPRAFGHGHIASLESFVGLTYAAGVFAVAELWPKGPGVRAGAIAGAFWGLCLLTKIQAVLLPVPVGLWALWHFRARAVGPLAAMAGVGLAVFFAGWPYLWSDPVGHFAEYFGRAGDRITLHVFFAGERYADREVPVLYAPLMFLMTQRAVWLAGGLLGAWRVVAGLRKAEPDESSRRWGLVLASALFPVAFFAVPRFATYDGVRLFLVAYPLWACLCGVGLAEVAGRVRERFRPRWVAAAAAFGLLLLETPLWLSHYGAQAGGSRGAFALGMEPTYWGDSLTRSLWAAVPDGSRVAVAPVLHQFQLPYVLKQTPDLADRGVTLEPWAEGTDADYVLAFRRRADLPEALEPLFDGDAVAETRTWNGVRVGVLVEN